MKTRGWFLAAVMAAIVIAPSYAMAQATSEAGDVVNTVMTDEQRDAFRKNTTAQNQIAENIVTTRGLTGDQAAQIRKTVSATNGTFMPSVNLAYNNLKDWRSGDPIFTPFAAGDIGPNAPGMAYALDMLFIDPANSYAITNSEYLALWNTADGYASTAGAVSGLDTIEANSGMMRRHMRGNRSDLRTAMNNCAPEVVNRIWASPFHNNISQKNKDGFAGYKYKMTGVGVGYDFMSGPLNIGASFIYSKGDFEWRDARDDNDIHNYGGSLYAQFYSQSGFFATVDGGFNYGKNKWNRYLSALDGIDAMNGWERGRNHTNSYWIGGTLGYDFKTCSGFTLTPTVGLQWEHAKSSAYNTAIDGDVYPTFMANGTFKKKSLLLPVELTAAYDYQVSDCSKISVRGTAGYTYNFKNKGAEGWVDQGGAGTGSYMRGMKSARHTWNAGVGLNYNYKSFDLGVDYRYEGGKKYQDHSVSATVGVRF